MKLSKNFRAYLLGFLPLLVGYFMTNLNHTIKPASGFFHINTLISFLFIILWFFLSYWACQDYDDPKKDALRINLLGIALILLGILPFLFTAATLSGTLYDLLSSVYIILSLYLAPLAPAIDFVLNGFGFLTTNWGSGLDSMSSSYFMLFIIEPCLLFTLSLVACHKKRP